MPAGARVVAALSGGADSTALVHLLGELDAAGVCRLVGVAHLNHQLRGQASEDDEVFCRELAARLGLRFEAERTDVAALSRQAGISIEAAGHQARRGFFDRAAERLAADHVAVAHTRDDQAETFLLRLFRGAGPRGLSGMHPKSGVVIRPALECSRAELAAYLQERCIAFREDASNSNVDIPRNRVRHELLSLVREISPNIVRVLAREAAIAREDADLLDRLAAERATAITSRSGDAILLDIDGLVVLPAAIARRVLVAAMQSAARGRHFGFDHVETVLDLARPGGPNRARHGVVYLPGQTAERRGGQLVLRPRGREAARPQAGSRAVRHGGTNSFRFSLSIPGEAVSTAGWAVSAERRRLDEAARQSIGEAGLPADQAFVDADRVSSPLAVRGWRPGDRLSPLGLDGTKKLQDVFTDRKVPRETRANVPLVVDGLDRVVWVAGHAIDGDFRVTASTTDVVILKLKYWRNGT